MIKIIITAFFSFAIGMCYGIYMVINPEQTALTDVIHTIAKIKGLFS